jgi:uncharacterized hydrophobic protein (TIGR00271 family)
MIQSGATVNFSFISGTVAASVIAGVGLGTDSGTMVVASMLISPLMGPLLAITFGLLTFDCRLLCKGVWAEVFGTILTVLVGALCGAVLAPVSQEYHWPTSAMVERGNWKALYSGLIFAIASGIAVGSAVSSGGINSLVGVAISASLLPPIVNSGMCIAFAYVADWVFKHDYCWGLNGRQSCNKLSKTDRGLYWDIAVISGALFAINVVVIIFVCLCMFKIQSLGDFERMNLQWWLDLPIVQERLERREEVELSHSVSSGRRGSGQFANFFMPAGASKRLRSTFHGGRGSLDEVASEHSEPIDFHKVPPSLRPYAYGSVSLQPVAKQQDNRRIYHARSETK